ncbi:acyl-CoA dehydrogenase family protein [Actinomadura sp. 7K507]|uniref:acyl-CoA dehydrogenase family protein n=1 Tax=Actinomadura sp. 7K507 TaxID=2530365 RepID=UPI0010461033|nr:acyl-CoA dehydrogenase family protein [Actinomadura sp. 7K507]TDC86397.1 acyl-CoA dehydrogenase [Actinomadura sp. 7K507]
MDLQEFRAGLDAWLDEHRPELEPRHGPDVSLDEEMEHLAKVKRLAYDAGWMRWGWPERVGGFGGSSLMRAYLGEALAFRDLIEPGIYSMTEVLAPTMIEFARPELAAEMVPRLLRGDETWCQGFSEPSTGSNLASLACRARREGDGWRVSGQKVWTSLAQFSDRCVLLTRTGAPESGGKGITALFVDMDSPGITVRPIRAMHGRDEFCEVFFDDVRVPFDRTLGEVDGGWAVAMDLLPYERSTSLWHRGAYLRQRLQGLLGSAPEGALDPAALGEVVQMVFAFQARSRRTQYRMARGERLGPETSIDKVMIATTEQAVYDLAADAVPADIAVGDDAGGDRWRTEFLYSRAATIYGGSAEVQRNIIARRLLDLGVDR